jgi:hypothetical protein
MPKQTKAVARDQSRKIIGFSLPPSFAAQVKAESERRKMTLRQIFEEKWSRYIHSSDRPVSPKPIKRERHPELQSRQIVGVSLSPELAAKVKVEAARRRIPLKKLFEGVWAN